MADNEVYFDQEDVDKNKGMAILIAVIPLLFFIPLVSSDMSGSRFMRFRANQTLVLFLIDIVLSVAGRLLDFIPFVGWILKWALNIIVIVLYVLNIVYALQGTGKKLPIIGGIEIIK